MRRWIVAGLALVALAWVMPAPASAMTLQDEAKWIETLDMDAGLYLAGGLGVEESSTETVQAYLGLSGPEAAAAPAEGKSWWGRNWWWVILLSLLPFAGMSGTTTTTVGAAGGAAAAAGP